MIYHLEEKSIPGPDGRLRQKLQFSFSDSSDKNAESPAVPDGITVGTFLKTMMHFSNHQVSSLKFREDGIRVNDHPERVSFVLKPGDLLEIVPKSAGCLYLERGNFTEPPEILYEDGDLLIVNKPSGMVCHPSPGHYADSLANQAAAYAETKNENWTIRLVGRLDKDTSGVVIFAKNSETAARLSAPSAIQKTYYALAEGILPEKGSISSPIAPDETVLGKMKTDPDGKPAETFYERVSIRGNNSLLKIHLLHGRTHQIRVHLASIGHPLVGDSMYGHGIKGQTHAMLCCQRVSFAHPFTGKPIECESGDVSGDSFSQGKTSHLIRPLTLEKIKELRHQLHRSPELSMQEKNTLLTVRSFLEKNTSFSVFDMGNWLYAFKPGVPGSRSVAFRADVDALPIEETLPLPYRSQHPGISHKCGHDGHAAALCGLALELEDYPVPNNIYLIFQPGEEIGEGAKICRTLLKEKDIQEIYAFHNLPGYTEGAIVYRHGLTQPASEGLLFSFQGQTSHASTPEKGRNPAAVIAEIVLFINELQQHPRQSMAFCTITGIRLGNHDFGISPGEGSLSLTIRAEEENMMHKLEKEITEFAENKAGRYGLSMNRSISDYFPETRNHDHCLKKVLSYARELQLYTEELKEPWRASEDFGYYLKDCPGAIFYIGAGENSPALHTADYDFNDRILETAVNLFCRLAECAE